MTFTQYDSLTDHKDEGRDDSRDLKMDLKTDQKRADKRDENPFSKFSFEMDVGEGRTLFPDKYVITTRPDGTSLCHSNLWKHGSIILSRFFC